MTWKNPTPVVVGLVRCGEGLVVIERSIEPHIGGFALPGGFVDEGEDAEMAMSREMYEETGFFFDQQLWSPVMTSITENNRLLIFMLCDEDLDSERLDKFVKNTECKSVRVALENEALCFPLHTKALQARALWS